MTWSNRFRLTGGLVVVLAVVVAATIHLNASQAFVASESAQVQGETYAVGTPYAGLVVERLVEVDDVVREGDELFLVDSASLRRDLAQGVVPPRTVEQDVDDDGHLVVRATGDGTITALDAEAGTFVTEGTEIATVQRAGSVHVAAQYLLTPQQYARIGERPRATVILPDRRTIDGEVSDVAVEEADGQAFVVLSVRSVELSEAESGDRLVAAGTPVVVDLHLTNDGVVNDLAGSVEAGVSSVTATVTSYVSDLVGGSST